MESIVVFTVLAFGILLAAVEYRSKQRYEELSAKIRWLKDDMKDTKVSAETTVKSKKKG